MIVTRENFADVLSFLKGEHYLSLDTETTGLRPYHGSRLFSIAIASPMKRQAFYLNFWPYAGLEESKILLPMHLKALGNLLSDPEKLWFLHNAKFDMAMLANEGLSLAGTIHCTQAIARLERNDHFKYSLEACAERIGLKKDDAVKAYMDKHHLWEWESQPGKKQRKKNYFFTKVPFEIISAYAETDALVTLQLGEHQMKTLTEMAELDRDYPKNVPNLLSLQHQERQLTRTVFSMEQVGLRIDRPYCMRAAQYEADRATRAVAAFKKETGRDYSASSKLFEDIFSREKDKWEYTDPTPTCPNGNPSFESDVLKRFDHPAAKIILEARDAKSKSDFYQGFLYHSDSHGRVHPNLNADGTATGRFSSSNPNFQNLTSEEEEEDLQKEFLIRRAIIPDPGSIFIMPDYDQMEYRLMLEVAARLIGRETELIKKVKGGLDVHEASRQLLLTLGIDHPRGIIKNGNFAILYGSGLDTLAWTIKGTREAARTLKEAIFRASPEIKLLVNEVMKTAKLRGYIFNLAGRRSYFPDPNFAYKAPNYLIQGGCADVVKKAMNELDRALKDRKSKMLLQVHDELLFRVDESEVSTVPRLVYDIMSTAFNHKYLPLTCSMEWSNKSMGDKVKGFPV